jgi:hypothetical protein
MMPPLTGNDFSSITKMGLPEQQFKQGQRRAKACQGIYGKLYVVFFNRPGVGGCYRPTAHSAEGISVSPTVQWSAALVNQKTALHIG